MATRHADKKTKVEPISLEHLWHGITLSSPAGGRCTGGHDLRYLTGWRGSPWHLFTEGHRGRHTHEGNFTPVVCFRSSAFSKATLPKQNTFIRWSVARAGMEGRCGERARERKVGQEEGEGWEVENVRVTCNGAGVVEVMGMVFLWG